MTRPLDDRHAAYVRWVADVALTSGLLLRPVVDDDDRPTDCLYLPINRGVILTIVVPYPPDDWKGC